MSIRLESIAFGNTSASLNRAPASMSLCRAPPAALGFETSCRPKTLSKVSMPSIPTLSGLNLRQRSERKRFVSSFAAASPDDSKASDIDVDKEKEDLKTGAQDSQEEWQQALESFKQHALKMQSISKEAYKLYSEKAIVILKETSENLTIQAEKANQKYLMFVSEYAENSPEPLKDIFETFASVPDEFKEISNLREFYVGMSYGSLLFGGGFISFMVTGSIPALRFGVILGGILLALSISSKRLWNKRMFAPSLFNEQMAIVTILFLREARLLFVRPFIANKISTLFSGVTLAMYIYIFIRDGGLRGFNPKADPKN